MTDEQLLNSHLLYVFDNATQKTFEKKIAAKAAVAARGRRKVKAVAAALGIAKAAWAAAARAKEKRKSKVDQREWSVKSSVWSRRERIADSRALYDGEDVLKASFKSDWGEFIRQIQSGGTALFVDSATIYSAKDALQEAYPSIMQLWRYYSVIGPTHARSHQVALPIFHSFVADFNLSDRKVCPRSQLDLVFIETNRPAADSDDGNDDRTLCRFEFVEAFLRIAILRYVTGGETNDIARAVERLVDHVKSISNMQHIFVPPDDFRRERMHFDRVDAVLQENRRRLHSIFQSHTGETHARLHSEKYSENLMTMKEWIKFLSHAEVFDPQFTYRKAQATFARSQMTVVKEMRNRKRFVCLTFEDFLEALCRCSVEKNMPTDAEIVDAGASDTPSFFMRISGTNQLEKFSTQDRQGKEQQLHETLPKFLELIYAHVQDGGSHFATFNNEVQIASNFSAKD